MRKLYEYQAKIKRYYPDYNLQGYTYTQIKIIYLCCKYNIPVKYHRKFIFLKESKLLDEIGLIIENWRDFQ